MNSYTQQLGQRIGDYLRKLGPMTTSEVLKMCGITYETYPADYRQGEDLIYGMMQAGVVEVRPNSKLEWMGKLIQFKTKLQSSKTKFLEAVDQELDAALKEHGEFNSCHEGYAVLLEELEELWEEVMKKRKKRDAENMYDECVQIAAMSMKFALKFGERK